jgi:hypothetical protein
MTFHEILAQVLDLLQCEKRLSYRALKVRADGHARVFGTLYVKLGQRERARTALSTAIDFYRATDMTFWLPQTEVILARLKD